MFGSSAKNLANSLQSLLDQTAEEVLVFDKNGRILFCNGKAKARCGVDLLNFKQYARHFLSAGDKSPIPVKPEPNHEYDWIDEQGHDMLARCVTVLWDGAERTALFVSKLYQNQQVLRRLETLAYTDSLTGVNNRRRFLEDFEKLTPQIASSKLTGMVAMLDLDNFKTVNDTYGHNTGDLLLKEFVKYAQTCLDGYGTLYRLGGDEFAILFSRPRAGAEATQREYAELLSNLLLSYSLPAIETECTVSMGLAFFPRHGRSASELLRRGDIALYEAKRRGRNRFAAFEEGWDTAKKFLDVYVNMSPILKVDNTTFGYRLVESSAKDEPEDVELLRFSDFDKTLDLIGLQELNGETKYFISYSEQLLSPLVMENIAGTSLVIEIRCSALRIKRIEDNCRLLHSKGICLAVSDFTPDGMDRHLVKLFDFLKIDMTTTPPGLVRQLRTEYPGKTLVAAGVDDYELFQSAVEQGYHLFQGYYFSAPIIKATKDIEPIKMNLLRLLKIVSSPKEPVDFHEISSIIEGDVALSYKLLRLLNSAAIGLRSTVTSIERAVVLLGEEDLRKWTTMLVMRGISNDKPQEVIRLSLMRASIGENLAPYLRPPADPKKMFLLGMFSMLDVAMNTPFSEILRDVTLDTEIVEALCTQKGTYSELPKFFQQYEFGNWDYIDSFSKRYNVPDGKISEMYMNAMAWYNQLINDLL